MPSIIVREQEGIKKYDDCLILDNSKIACLSSSVKVKILELLSEKAMFISEISKKLNLNEQNVYYHMRDLFPLLEVVEEKKIRGTIAKKFKPKSMNFCTCLSNNFKDYNDLNKKSKQVHSFFSPFIKNGHFNAKFVVGSPDQHGPYKSRARDGHYAIDLAMYLGNFALLPKDFTVSLDVDINLKTLNSNLVIVGGPVTNLIMDAVNSSLPVKFVESKQWSIRGRKDLYFDDNTGIIARIPHPYYDDKWILALAGIRFSGTKSTVLALTRNIKLALNHFTGQKRFYAIIHGFDLDGDGKIDSVELLESC